MSDVHLPRDAQVSLRDYVDMRFTEGSKAVDAALVAQEKAVSAAMEAANKATSKAERAANDRFEAVNEFRQTLTDQASTFVTNAEFKAVQRLVWVGLGLTLAIPTMAAILLAVTR
jgi:hypothetical protein